MDTNLIVGDEPSTQGKGAAHRLSCAGMTRLLIFNAADFKGFSVAVIDPATV